MKLKELWYTHSTTRQNKPHASKTTMKHAIIRGAPDDRGVLNVGGRVGAARGPGAFAQAIGNMSLGPQDELAEGYLRHGGDIPLEKTISQTHQSVVLACSEDLKQGHTSILIGGGHDYGYPQIAALAETFGAKHVGVINIDAHLDLRAPVDPAKITSGSPYYLALENKKLMGKHLVEFGIQPHCNSAELFEYAKKHKVKILSLSQARTGGSVKNFAKALKLLSKSCKAIALSIDLDALSLAYAPGVSAPQPDGFAPSEIIEMLMLAAKTPKVCSLGVFELAPSLDVQDHTARLAAVLVHRFALARVAS